jgi:[NiFe] hydrogenase assembly HybE family chaperone
MNQSTHGLSAQEAALLLETCFTKILHENMQGINILNHELDVEAVEFQEWDDRIMGMMITPWFVSLIILPKAEENWEGGRLGEKENMSFPSRDCEMMLNEIEGFGLCKTHSIYSPCTDLPNQESARIAAAMFLRNLLDETKRVDPTYSEEQIARYLEKEDMVHQEELKKQFSEPIELKKEVNRRDLIRGKVRKS